MYMDDIKLFAKNEKELETQIQTVRIYSQDIGMEFYIEKCDKIVIKSRKRHFTKGIELPYQEKNRMLGVKETYKYLGILEADIIKQVKMKKKLERVSQEDEKATRDKTIGQKLYKRDKFLGCPSKRTREDIKQMDQKTRKLMAMNKALHWWRQQIICVKKGGRKMNC